MKNNTPPTYYQNHTRSPYFITGSTQSTSKPSTSLSFKPSNQRNQTSGVIDQNFAPSDRKSSVPILRSSLSTRTSRVGQEYTRQDTFPNIRNERKVKNELFNPGKGKVDSDYSSNYTNFQQSCAVKENDEVLRSIYAGLESGNGNSTIGNAWKHNSRQSEIKHRHKSSDRKPQIQKWQRWPEFPGAFSHESPDTINHTTDTSREQLPSISYQSYLQRLIQAHTIVDELLKSRGMKPENEINFLRYIRFQVPTAVEELNDASRRSSGSDSGLSLGNDYDQYANPSEEIICETTLRKNQESFHDIIILYKIPIAFSHLNITIKKEKKIKNNEIKIKVKKLSTDKDGKRKKCLHKFEQTHYGGTFRKSPEALNGFTIIKKSNVAFAHLRMLTDNMKKTTKKRIMKITVNRLPDKVEKSCTKGTTFGFPTQCSIVECFYRPMRFNAHTITIKAIPEAYRVNKKVILRNAFVKKNFSFENKKIQAHCSMINLKIKHNVRVRLLGKFKSKIQVKMANFNKLESFLGKQMRKVLPAHARKKDFDRSGTLPHEIQMVSRRVTMQNNKETDKKGDEINNFRRNLKKVDFNKTVSNKGLNVYQISQIEERLKANDPKKVLPKVVEPLSNSNSQRAEPCAIATKFFLKPPVKEKNCHNEKQLEKRNEVVGSRMNQKEPINHGEMPSGDKGRSISDRSTVEHKGNSSKRSVQENSNMLNIYRREIPKPKAVIRRSPSPLRFTDVNSAPFYQNVTRAFLVQAKTEIKQTKKCVLEHKSNAIRNFPSQEKISAVDKLKITGPPPKKHLSKVPLSKPQPKTNQDKFGIVLRSVNKRDLRSMLVVTQQSPKKLWIPRWRKTERFEQKQAEEQEDIQQKKMADTRFENSNDNSHAFSEAEKAVIAARKRQELEEAAKLLDYQERRRVERMNEDEELRMLRAKQERRRLERKEEEEREMVEKKKEEERLRNLQEEKARKETELKMKNTEKRKQSSLISLAASTNQLIPVKSLIKTDRTDKFGNIVQAKQEMGMTKEQQEQVKRSYLTSVRNSMDLSAASSEEIKVKIKQLYQRICRLESEKYDLEKRHERQEYDLKELNERQRQVARNKFGRTNVNVISDKFAVKYPPKVAIVSKYDRQIDRRGFSERRALFENKAAFPCFPNVPPSSQNHSFIVNKILSENEDGDEENEEDEMRYGVVPSKYKNTLHMKEDENKYNDNKCKEAEKVQLSKMEVQQFISSKGKGKKKNEEVESEEDEEIDGQDEIVPMVTYIGKKTTDKWEESVDDEDEEEDEEEDDEDDEEEHEEEDEKELKITVPVTHIEARTVDEPNEVSSEDEEEEEEEDEEYHEEDEEEGEE